MINDLWGVMIALFGTKWTSQFGEKTDPSGQWGQTLKDVTRAQVAEALESLRNSGRTWPPTAPEFKSMCKAPGGGDLKSVDSAHAEFIRYLTGRIDRHSLSPEVYHTLRQNCSEYNLRAMSSDKSSQEFRSAYRATLDDYRSGQEIAKPPAPETLIEQIKPRELTNDERENLEKRGEETLSNLMAMFGGVEDE